MRFNDDGELKTKATALCSAAVDPIEKKPLYHFLPGSKSFSICTPGCNLSCPFCQNASISQTGPDGAACEETAPEKIVQAALDNGCKSISYTYTEPTIFFELAEKTALLAKEKGLKNVFVTNGLYSAEAIERAAGWLDAANIDLKSMDESFYRCCGASLAPVLDNIVRTVELGIWVELTNLLIPGKNDSDEQIAALARFVADNVGSLTPLHISAFYPAYKMLDVPAQSAERVVDACEIARDAGLKYVYPGNITADMSSYCHNCGRVLIGRSRFRTDCDGIIDGRCELCGEQIPGVFV